jgi:hypothetical protein
MTSNKGKGPAREKETEDVQRIRYVEPLKAPMLKDLARMELVKFTRNYEIYKSKALADGLHYNSIKDCMDGETLELAAVQYIKKKMEEVSAEDVDNLLKKLMDEEVEISSIQMTNIFKNCCMDLKTLDPKKRVMDYNKSYRRITEQHGLTKAIENNDQIAKQVVISLIGGVRPSVLRQVVQQKARTSDARTDPIKFFDMLEAAAINQNMYHEDKLETVKYWKNKMGRDTRSDTPASGSRGQKRKRNLPCLICKKENHVTREHRGATKEVLDDAFKKYRAEKAQVSLLDPINSSNESVVLEIARQGPRKEINFNKVNTLSPLNELVNSTPEPRHKIMATFPQDGTNPDLQHISLKSIMTSECPLFTLSIEENMQAQFQFDSGSSASVICNYVVKQLKKTKPYMLKPVVQVDLPFKLNKQVLSTEGITLDIVLNAPNGETIKCKGVQFIIINEDMEIPILLGNTFLVSMGIDVPNLIWKQNNKANSSNQMEQLIQNAKKKWFRGVLYLRFSKNNIQIRHLANQTKRQ